MERTTPLLMLAVVVWLCFVHIPSDVKHRSLKRSHTLGALVGLSVIALIDIAAGDSTNQVTVVLPVVLTVGSVYWLLHRRSPDSLGFGDVLLVLPLSLSLAWLDVMLVLIWQLAASCIGAIHAVIQRLRLVSQSIPFAPHLLLTALFLMTLNIWIVRGNFYLGLL